jgi:ABC-type anion transport system duplicated permease subunit
MNDAEMLAETRALSAFPAPVLFPVEVARRSPAE